MSGRERTALGRLVVICAAWALGETLVRQVGAYGLDVVVPALLAGAAYFATQGIGWSGSDVTYWRGQRIDRDRWRR